MGAIDSLFAELGFEFDDENLKKFNEGFEQATKILVTVVAGAAAAQAAITAFTKKIAETNDEIGKFAKRSGVALDVIQELGFVAELNGDSIDSMNSSLVNLSKTASESARGMGSNVETFGLLGLSVTDTEGKLKSTEELLYDVSDAIAGLGTQAERMEFASKLGIGDELLLSIQDGSEAIKRQREEARALGFVIDKEAAKAAADFNDNLLRMTKIIQGVASAIGTRLMKQMKPFHDAMIAWFKANKAIIQQNLEKVLDGISKATRVVFNILLRVFRVVDNLAKGFGGWKNAIMIVVGAMALLNASALLLPLLILAGGAALLLLIEDIQKFAEGGDSALGAFIEKFPLMEAPLRLLIKLMKMVGEGWSLILGPEGLQFIKDIGAAIDEVAEKVQNLLEKYGLLDKKEGLSATVQGRGLFEEGIDYPGKTENKTAWSNLTSALGTIFRGQSIDPGSTEQLRIPVAQRINNNNSKATNIFNINGGNPAEVEATVKRVIGAEYRSAEINLTTPVDQ